MHNQLILAAVILSLTAVAAAQAPTTTSSVPTQPNPTTQATPAFKPPQHKKPKTYTPDSDSTASATGAKQAQSTQTAPEFDHVALEVRDIAKSADFYQRVLGLPVIADPFNDAQHVFLRLGSHSQLHLVKKAAAASAQPRATANTVERARALDGFHFAVRVADVQAFAARLDRMKIAFSDTNDQPHKISKRPDGVSQIYFQDPDGYWIEVNDDKF